MFGVNVGTILCGFRASTTVPWNHLYAHMWHRSQLTSQIWARKCGSNSRMIDPYSHPQHMKVVNDLVYVWSRCLGSIPCGFWASTTAPWDHLCAHRQWHRSQLTSQIWANKYGGNCMMTDPYPQEQNTKVVYDLVYVLVNVGAIPCGCNASTTAPWHHLWHTRNTDLSWLLKSGPASVVVMAWWQIHIPIHSIWRLSMTSCVWSECGSHSMWV